MKKVAKHSDISGLLMVTYRLTHGVFWNINKTHTQLIHDNGGQSVYGWCQYEMPK